MNKRLLFLDTETGGTNPQKHSLLSIGIVVWDKDEGILFTDEFFIQNDSYNVTIEAKRINHFNELEHKEKAIAPIQIVNKLTDIKKTFFSDYDRIPLAGHNIVFDIQFIKQLFSSCARSYEKTFSHRSVDTHSIIRFLSDCELIPNTVSSSASAFKYFNVPINGRHTALGDAMATAQLYMSLLSMVSCQKK